MSIREQVQDGQYRANEIIRQIQIELDSLPRIAQETFKEELSERLKEMLQAKINQL